MCSNFDFFGEFFTNIEKLLQIYAPNAKRSGISAEAAVLLTVYSEFPDIELRVNPEIISELSAKGLIQPQNGKNKITSKGAILAKAFIALRKANF